MVLELGVELLEYLDSSNISKLICLMYPACVATVLEVQMSRIHVCILHKQGWRKRSEKETTPSECPSRDEKCTDEIDANPTLAMSGRRIMPEP